MSIEGRSCHNRRAVRARSNFFGISGDPPGDHCHHQEASRKEQKPPRGLWDIFVIVKENRGRPVVCLQLSFSGVLWAVWVGTSWDGAPVFDYEQLPRRGRGARAVCARCNDSHLVRPLDIEAPTRFAPWAGGLSIGGGGVDRAPWLEPPHPKGAHQNPTETDPRASEVKCVWTCRPAPLRGHGPICTTAKPPESHECLLSDIDVLPAKQSCAAPTEWQAQGLHTSCTSQKMLAGP